MQIPAEVLNEIEYLGTIRTRFTGQPLSAEDIEKALQNPIWRDNSSRSVFELVQPGKSVCLVVSDHTRRTGTNLVLPVLLKGLCRRGCDPRDIFVIVATGIHRPPTDAEIHGLLGSEVAHFFAGRIWCHDADDESNLVPVGTTRRGHSVRLNRRAVEADRLILVGAASYHYHAGFGGGRKSLVPGLASRDTIAYNHSLTLDPNADRIHPGVEIGRLEGNPVAEEMLEAAHFVEPDFIINTVLTPEGHLAGCFAGDMELAHHAACRRVEEVCRFDISQRADIVIASAEGARNWIQSHKALYNASRALNERGRIVLLAPCPEGIGDERFRYWLRRSQLGSIYPELRQSPEVNGQTALSTRMHGARTILVTDMNAQDLSDLGIPTAPDLISAVRQAIAEVRERGHGKPICYLMPQAREIVPFLASQTGLSLS
ncbi:MAG: nickel-dependent lactate racemase [Kiritimatiellia bacterium]